jgi:hypothetical protein
MNSKRLILVSSIIVLAVLSRLLPHPYNFTPIAGIALFGAAHFRKNGLAWLIPLSAMWISDLVINNVYYAAFNDGFVWFTSGFYWMYGSFALIALVGYFLLDEVSIPKLIGGSLFASILFFLITNFGVWLGSASYSQIVKGLIACYTSGIPFFGNTIGGDLFYTGVLFGSYEFAKRQIPSLAHVLS